MILAIAIGAVLLAGCTGPYKMDIPSATKIVPAGKTASLASGGFDKNVKFAFTVRATSTDSTASGVANITIQDGAQHTQHETATLNGPGQTFTWAVAAGSWEIKADCFANVDCDFALSGHAEEG